MNAKIKKISTKRVLSILLFVIIMFLLCLTTFSTSISYAEKIVVSSDIALRTYNLDEVVEQKLGQGNYSYEYISGFADEDRYILVEGDNCYLIYDTVVQRHTEYSKTDNSMYYYMPTEAEKIYYAPTYYYARQNGDVVDLTTSTILSSEDVLLFKQSAIEKKTADLQKIAQTSNVALNDNINSISNYVVGDPGNIGDIYYVESAFVPCHYYFENLTSYYTTVPTATAMEIGLDFFEALSMLFSYYDTIIDDRVIDDSFEYNVTYNGFVDTEYYDESPRATYEFDEYLLDLFHDYGYDEGNVNREIVQIGALANVIKDYLSPKGIYANPYITKIGDYGNATAAKDNIYHGHPYAMHIGDTLPPVYAHYVIAYGFADYSDLYVHNVVSNAQTGKLRQLVIDISLQAGTGFSLGMDYENWYPESHTCGNNYLWEYQGCAGTRCACGKFTCNHASATPQKISSALVHQLICNVCGNLSTQAHSFETVVGRNRCTICGYLSAHTHSYTYTPSLVGKTHIATCMICGISSTENCKGFSSLEGSFCSKCGQKLS